MNLIPPLPSESFIISCSQGLSIDPNGDGSSYALGYLFITFTQGAYSLTELTDVNPLDIGTLLGNIGGFWGKLLSPSMPSLTRI